MVDAYCPRHLDGTVKRDDLGWPLVYPGEARRQRLVNAIKDVFVDNGGRALSLMEIGYAAEARSPGVLAGIVNAQAGRRLGTG
jgi:hypothetical protein